MRQRLASVTATIGRVQDAAGLYSALIADHERGVATDIELVTRFGYGQLMAQLGEFDIAERELSIVLKEERALHGPDHQETLITRAVLADVWTGRGRLKEARAELEDVLAAQERLFGSNSPMTLAARVALLSVTSAMQDESSADNQLGQLLKIQRELNPEHPLALLGLAALVNTQANSGAEDSDSRVNEQRLREVCQAMTHTLGPDNALVLNTQLGAAIQRHQHEPDAAEDEISEIIARQTERHGRTHSVTLNSRLVQAQLLVQRGDRLDIAEQSLIRLLQDQLETFGPTHPQTIIVRYALANIEGLNGDLATSEDHLRNALASLETWHESEPDHADIQETRGTLVQVLCGLEQYKAAEPELLTLIDSIKRTEGDDALEALGARTILAQLWAADNRPGPAEQELRAVLARLRDLAHVEDGVGGSLLVQVLIAGLVRLRGGDDALAEAEQLLADSLRRLEEGWGVDDEDALAVRIELGEVLHERGSLAESERCLQLAVSRLTQEYGDDDERTRRAAESLSIVGAELQAALPATPPPNRAAQRLSPAGSAPPAIPAAEPVIAPAQQVAAAWRRLLDGDVEGARAAFATVAGSSDGAVRMSADHGLTACAAATVSPAAEPAAEPSPTVQPQRQARTQPTAPATPRPEGRHRLLTAPAATGAAAVRSADTPLSTGRLAAAERDLRAALRTADGESADRVRAELVRLLIARGKLADVERVAPPEEPGHLWELRFWLAELRREQAVARTDEVLLRALVRDGAAGVGRSTEPVLEARQAYALALADLGHPWAAYADLHALARTCDRAGLQRVALAARVAAAAVRPPGAPDERDTADSEIELALRAAVDLAGPEDDLTLRARRARGRLRLLRGDPSGAAAELREVLTARQRLSDPPDREQAGVRHDLGTALHAAGRLDDAEGLHRSVVDELGVGLGAGHPDTLRARVALAAVRRDQEPRPAPAELHRLLVEQAERRGDDHPDLAVTHYEFGVALARAGDTPAARREHERAAEISTAVWGDRHPWTVRNRGALARL